MARHARRGKVIIRPMLGTRFLGVGSGTRQRLFHLGSLDQVQLSNKSQFLVVVA